MDEPSAHVPHRNRHLPSRRDVLAGGLAASVTALSGCSPIAAGDTGPSHPGMVLDLPRAANGQIASYYPSVIGRVYYYVAKHEDSLVELARAHGLGFTEVVAANQGVDPWLPGAGTRILLPKAHLLPEAEQEGLVLNLADQRIYYFVPGGQKVLTYPVGIGSQGWKTPLGKTEITRKRENPIWYVPKSIRAQQPDLPAAVKAGPDNPLGRHALYLAWPSYLIHGTNKPWGVGRRASHGCVRLYPEDIEKLFAMIKTRTPVRIVDQQAKTGWVGDDLVLEVHPSQQQADQLEATGKLEPEPVPELQFRLLKEAGDKAKRLDWPLVNKLVETRTGVPTKIFRPASSGAGTRRG